MNGPTARRGRAFAGAAAIGVTVALAVVVLASTQCTETKRDLGQGCLRNVDCVSGSCAGQVCVAPPTVFDAAPRFDAGIDAAPDGASDAHDAAPPVDVSPPRDVGMPPKDTGSDVTTDARDGGAEGGALDAPTDSPAGDRDAPIEDAKPDAMDASHAPG